MANSKLLMLSIVFALAISGIMADTEQEIGASAEDAADEGSGSPAGLELEELRSMISALESSIFDRTNELKRKDESIAQLERVIEEMSASFVSLQSKPELIQNEGAMDAEELAGKEDARADELEKQIKNLKDEIKAEHRKGDALEARAVEAERKVHELSLQLKSLEKANDEQRSRIRKTERVLQVAEEELAKAKLEAGSKLKELMEIHGAWLPPWFAAHVAHCKDLIANHWNEHGKPFLELFFQKFSEKSAQAQKWMEPHLEIAKTKWIPAFKEQVATFTFYLKPHIDMVSAKTIETYGICRSTIAPHIVKVKELAGAHLQEVRKFSKPYINHIAAVTKPHAEQVRVVCEPYTMMVSHAYGKILESPTRYHQQVQGIVHEKLEKHELTKPLASKELVWIVASALLALPVFILYKIFSAIFCNRTKRTTNSGDSTPRRPRRRQAGK